MIIDNYSDKLPDDIITKIYSYIIYEQPTNLLIEINNYNFKKKNINLFYKTIIQHWSYCYIDPLSKIWYYYYIENINRDFDITNFEDLFNIEMNNAEIFRILKSKNKKILIKKYIFKYLLNMSNIQIDKLWNDFICLWGSYDENYNDLYDYHRDTSLDNLNTNYVNYLCKYVHSPILF